MAAKYKQPSSSGFFENVDPSSVAGGDASASMQPAPKETAMVYCEGFFGTKEGQVASDLLRSSEKYEIVSIIDSEQAGKDAGKVLDGTPNGTPIYSNLGTALAQSGRPPRYLVCAVTPESGILSESDRRTLIRAIGYRINIASDLHEFLNGDPEFIEACEKKGVSIVAV